jgi:hypothetical protein
MKITFCCIVFNGDFVLKQLIDSIYPFAHKIIFVDGVVDYWHKRGFTGSFDNTKKIIIDYPDIANKIILHTGIVAPEKTELCRHFMPDVPNDTNYIWAIDSDEIFKSEHIKATIDVLESRSPTSVGFQSTTFFGGFDYVLDGFEREHSFKRILKYEPGCTYVTHRPPTLSTEQNPNCLHISGQEMAQKYGVEMYHYSYVLPTQVHSKIDYYKAAVSKDNCIDDYFNKVWLKWVLADDNDEERLAIEKEYNGVHEFKPSYRGPCYPRPFLGQHPYVIQRSLPELKERIDQQLKKFAVLYRYV